MATDLLPPHAAHTQASAPRARVWVWVAAAVVVSAIAVLTVVQTGGAPRHAGRTTIPTPPIVLRDDLVKDRNLSQGSNLLAAGQVVDARKAFERAERASKQKDDDRARAAAIGISLTTWQDVGPTRVRRAIDTLGDQPGWDDDGYISLHLGVIDLLRTGQAAAAKHELADARSKAFDAKAWDIARRADDLAHPSLPPGYPPIIVDPAGLAGTNAKTATFLRSTIVEGDRPKAAELGAHVLAADGAPLQLRAMAWTARWTKDTPTRDLATMHRAVDGGPLDLRLQVALLDLWSGESKTALAELRTLAAATPHSADDRAVIGIASQVLAQRAKAA